MDNSSKKIENSSSQYYDACSDSKELDEIYESQERKKESAKNLKQEKEDEIKNIYESPKRIPNNKFNVETNNNNETNSNNGPSNYCKNMIISTKEQTNNETEKSQTQNKSRIKINIYAMNSVKKKLMSPIEEKKEIFNSNKRFDFSNNGINSKDNLMPKVNNINEIRNNNNNNININIIINKNKKLKKDFKHNVQDIKTSNTKKHKSRHKIEIINTNINSEKASIYSSFDKFSNSTTLKKIEKKNPNNINTINNKNSEFSYFEINTNKIFGNSISESLIQNKFKPKKGTVEPILDFSSLVINSVTFQNIKKDSLTVDDLKMKYNLREIAVKRKEQFIYKNKYIHTLIELQIFNFGDSPIWVMKISYHGKYLATGNKAGKIRIYELMGYDYDGYEPSYNIKNIINYLYFVNEKPIIELSEHKKDITDLSWSPFRHNLLLSSSIDNYVILWDISQNNNCLIEKYKHDDYVTCVQFSPIDDNVFITGGFDKFVRLFNINKSNEGIRDTITKSNTLKLGFLYITDKITSMSFYPDGSQIAVGTINGKIYVYDFLYNTGRYNHNFNCRNRVGKNSSGKKVTSITFINKKNAIISTCDSSVRLISMNDGKNLSKYKGNMNENGMIRSDVDFSNDIIISGSEDGFCYTWKILAEDEKYLKNYNYESFKPFERDIVECCIVVNEECYTNYMKKVLKFTNKINIISIFINSTDNGKIEVLLNINEEIN